ncbi:MAG: hypothetical protein Q4A74_07275 [Cardiobacteriaceae bacterium]|nr:hypothetical protein [Cardiobacteriaceae bacterium]
MPYEDVSPQGQSFMNFSRPLALRIVAKNADVLTFEMIYGFGEYRFNAMLSLHDSVRDIDTLSRALEAGAKQGEIVFADEGGQLRLVVQGEENVLQFFCYEQNATQMIEVLPWLQGEVGRNALVSMLRAVME